MPQTRTAKRRAPTVWMTGLSGAGKSTLCSAVRDMLEAESFKSVILDGDQVRAALWPDLGYTEQARLGNIARLAWVAKLLSESGVIVLVAAISPYRKARADARASLEPFIEVYVNSPLAVCERRDPKGLYARARSGRLNGMTGVDAPYEPPLGPDVECRTDYESVLESASKILKEIHAVLLSP